jgi:heme-degrading monooxygenase HmoA
MATVSGPPEDFDDIVTMAAESLLPWIRQFEGYRGFLVLADRDSGTAHFMTLWESRNALERSAHSRKQVREQLARTAGAEIASTGAYTVVLTDGV